MSRIAELILPHPDCAQHLQTALCVRQLRLSVRQRQGGRLQEGGVAWVRVCQVTVAQVVVGVNQRGRGDDWSVGVGGVRRRLSGQTEHHGGRMLRGLKVGGHEWVLWRYRGLDGGRDSDDGGLSGDAVVEGGRLVWKSVSVGEEVGLAHGGDWGSPCRTCGQRRGNK